MKKNSIRLFILNLAIVSASAFAGDLTGKFGLGVDAGIAIPVGDRAVRNAGDVDLALQVHAQNYLTRSFGLELAYDRLDLGTNFRLDGVNLSALYRFMPEGTFSPTIQAGFGGTRVDLGPASYSVVSLKAGAGAEYMVSDSLALNLKGQYHFLTKKRGVNNNVHAIAAVAGLTYYFGMTVDGENQIAARRAKKQNRLASTKTWKQKKAAKSCDCKGRKVAEAKPQSSVTLNYFFNSTEVQKNHFEALSKFASELKENPDFTAMISGHSDGLGAEGVNMEFSKMRADAVRDYLIKQHGIDGSRLFTIGYGSYRPVSDNQSKDGRKANRRVIATIQK